MAVAMIGGIGGIRRTILPSGEDPDALDTSLVEDVLDGDDPPAPPPAEVLENMPPLQRMRWLLWVTLEDPESSRLAKYISVLVMITITVSVTAFLVASWPVGGCRWNKDETSHMYGQRYCPESNGERLGDLQSLKVIEAICVIIFTVEYMGRLASSGVVMSVAVFLCSPLNLIDLAAIMPFYLNLILGALEVSGDARFVGVLRVVRLVRVVRIFKFSKSFAGMHMLMRTVKRSASALMILFSLTLIFCLLFGTLIFMAEGGTWEVDDSIPADPDDPNQEWGQFIRENGGSSPFKSIPVSIYWVMVTMSSVGYGDMWPISKLGYFVGMLTIIGGLVTLALPITIISANFDEEARNYERFIQSQKRVKARRRAKQGVAQTEAAQQAAAQTAGPESPTILTPRPAAVDVGDATGAQSSLERQVRDSYGLEGGIDDTLADYRESLTSSIDITIRRMERDLQDHVLKIVLLSNVLKSRRRRKADDSQGNIGVEMEDLPVEAGPDPPVLSGPLAGADAYREVGEPSGSLSAEPAREESFVDDAQRRLFS